MNILNGFVLLRNDFVLSPLWLIHRAWSCLSHVIITQRIHTCFAYLIIKRREQRAKVLKLLSEETAQVVEVFYLCVSYDNMPTTRASFGSRYLPNGSGFLPVSIIVLACNKEFMFYSHNLRQCTQLFIVPSQFLCNAVTVVVKFREPFNPTSWKHWVEVYSR